VTFRGVWACFLHPIELTRPNESFYGALGRVSAESRDRSDPEESLEIWGIQGTQIERFLRRRQLPVDCPPDPGGRMSLTAIREWVL